MMGMKERHFAPLIHVSLEELVPADHFYRHVERTLDLSFVREFVHETYAGGGRPSIDPVVFFKLQLVMFFEGIRSERQLLTETRRNAHQERLPTASISSKQYKCNRRAVQVHTFFRLFCSSCTRVPKKAGVESEAKTLRGKLSLTLRHVYINNVYRA